MTSDELHEDWSDEAVWADDKPTVDDGIEWVSERLRSRYANPCSDEAWARTILYPSRHLTVIAGKDAPPPQKQPDTRRHAEAAAS